MIAAFGFVSGAICSAVAGYVSMWVAAQSNIRVASAARRSYGEALVVCFRGGAFSAVLNLTLCISGVAGFFTLLIMVFANGPMALLKVADVPMLLVGYGFGASFVALFMQLGGGIYTKAADVGADLVGKVEQSIPEDDPRNPAVIADLVGDMVGDCVGSSADVFESVAAEIIGAMILGSTLSTESGMNAAAATKFLLFPLVVHAMDIIVSSIGIAFVGVTRDSADSNPMRQMQKGYLIAISLSIGGFYIITSWLLEDPNNPGSAFKFFLCGIVGMVCAYVIVLSTQYYTDYEYSPVKSIAEASTTGHGTNIIVGISVGMKATLIPTLTVAVAVLTAYHLGESTGIGDGRNAGLFGTAVATMGMLSSAVYVPSEEREDEATREAALNPKLPLPLHVDAPDPVVDRTVLGILVPEVMPAPILNFDGIPFPGVGCNCASARYQRRRRVCNTVRSDGERRLSGLQQDDRCIGPWAHVAITAIWTSFRRCLSRLQWQLATPSSSTTISPIAGSSASLPVHVDPRHRVHRHLDYVGCHGHLQSLCLSPRHQLLRLSASRRLARRLLHGDEHF